MLPPGYADGAAAEAARSPRPAAAPLAARLGPPAAAPGYRGPMPDPEPAPRPVEPRTIREAGELGLLARILRDAPIAQTAELGPGDDAAVLRAPDSRVVVTTDTMIEGPDFRPEWSRPEELGWKAVASNLADVAAMGARPTGLVVSLAAPGDTPLAWMDGFAAGLRDGLAAMAPGAGLIGGDLATAPQLVIAVTAFGDLEGRPPVRRDGARPGDVLALAGPAGMSAAGLALLFARADGASAEPLRAGSPAAARLVAAQTAPTPPVAAGRDAALAGATAMMDVSDGLLLDAHRLAAASGVAIELERARLAPDAARLDGLLDAAGGLPGEDALELVLRGGEDHALLAAFPPGAALPAPFRAIGRVVASEPCRGPVRLDGADRAPEGWDPYRSASSAASSGSAASSASSSDAGSR